MFKPFSYLVLTSIYIVRGPLYEPQMEVYLISNHLFRRRILEGNMFLPVPYVWLLAPPPSWKLAVNRHIDVLKGHQVGGSPPGSARE